MLTDAHATLPAADLNRLRQFYDEKLGIQPTQEIPGLLIYGSGPSAFQVYETPNAGSATNTQLTWVVEDLDAEMRRLRGAGVTFEDYDQPGLKTENGVAEFEGGRGAWFRDSEGNIHNLMQMPPGMSF
jgi:catechol 2,3-dioxygenase-like lactoylglutathione lyase family enzyme